MTTKLKFPTHLRKMWSGSEVQEWLDKQQAEQEPVALVSALYPDGVEWFKCVPEGTKLYAAPVRTKDLTYEEVVEIIKDLPFNNSRIMDAIAVIKAYREKNK